MTRNNLENKFIVKYNVKLQDLADFKNDHDYFFILRSNFFINARLKIRVMSEKYSDLVKKARYINKNFFNMSEIIVTYDEFEEIFKVELWSRRNGKDNLEELYDDLDEIPDKVYGFYEKKFNDKRLNIFSRIG